MLVQVGQALAQLARPYAREDTVPSQVLATLWQLGMPCDALTPREVLIAELWARKRSLSVAFRPSPGNHDWTPPAA